MWRKVLKTEVWDPLLLREVPIVPAARPKVKPPVAAKRMPRLTAKQRPVRIEETTHEKRMRGWDNMPWRTDGKKAMAAKAAKEEKAKADKAAKKEDKGNVAKAAKEAKATKKAKKKKKEKATDDDDEKSLY